MMWHNFNGKIKDGVRYSSIYCTLMVLILKQESSESHQYLTIYYVIYTFFVGITFYFSLSNQFFIIFFVVIRGVYSLVGQFRVKCLGSVQNQILCSYWFLYNFKPILKSSQVRFSYKVGRYRVVRSILNPSSCNGFIYFLNSFTILFFLPI